MKLNPETCVSAQAVIAWFLQNYEDPAEACPFDEGGYVYIYGGPRYARDEIEAHCCNASADAVERAVKYLEQGDADYDGSGRPGCVAWSCIMEGAEDGVDIYGDASVMNAVRRRQQA